MPGNRGLSSGVTWLEFSYRDATSHATSSMMGRLWVRPWRWRRDIVCAVDNNHFSEILYSAGVECNLQGLLCSACSACRICTPVADTEQPRGNGRRRGTGGNRQWAATRPWPIRKVRLQQTSGLFTGGQRIQLLPWPAIGQRNAPKTPKTFLLLRFPIFLSPTFPPHPR
jgi:hypothetical protein